MKKTYQVFLHLMMWTLVFILPVVRFTFFKYPDRFHTHDYLQLLLDVFLNLVNFYGVYFFIIPKNIEDFFKPKTILKIIGFIVLMIFLKFTLMSLFRDFIDLKFFVNKYTTTWYIVPRVFLYVLLAIVVKLSIGWFFFQNLQRELLIHKQQSELSMLRAQINPHFLFNTLNNIYSLAQNNSSKTPEAIMKLSDMMRYTTKDVYSEVVDLDKEIQFISNFISLQKLRIPNPNQINFKIEGDTKNKQIAPLLLIPFVENAFKHGSKINSHGVLILLTCKNNHIQLIVENYYLNVLKKSKSGTGLENVKKRLEILYKDKYKLTINKKENIYSIHLTIELL